MKSAILVTITVLAGMLASCRPHQETPPVPPVGPPTGEAPKPAGNREGGPAITPVAPEDDMTPPKPGGETVEKPPVSPDPEPVKPKQQAYEVARPVPGKPGYVFSPNNNKIVDVKGIPSGQLVEDPSYPGSKEHYFRIP